MNVNFLPREPLFYRFFYGWVVLAIVLVLTLAIACYQLYALETRTSAALQQQNEQLSETKDELSKELSAYREREQFWEEHEPYYSYQEIVEEQAAKMMPWDTILSDMDKALPDGGQVFQLEVMDRVVQGLGVVHSVEGVASFMQHMQEVSLVEDLTLEVVNAPEEFAPLYIEAEQATIFRFRFSVAEQSEQSEQQNRGVGDEA